MFILFSVDWVLAENLALRAGAGGHVRYILKDSIRFIPLYGYFLYKHGCVYVRRKEGDRNMIGNQLRALVSQKRPVRKFFESDLRVLLYTISHLNTIYLKISG